MAKAAKSGKNPKWSTFRAFMFVPDSEASKPKDTPLVSESRFSLIAKSAAFHTPSA
jgi:hypothetical protein